MPTTAPFSVSSPDWAGVPSAMTRIAIRASRPATKPPINPAAIATAAARPICRVTAPRPGGQEILTRPAGATAIGPLI